MSDLVQLHEFDPLQESLTVRLGGTRRARRESRESVSRVPGRDPGMLFELSNNALPCPEPLELPAEGNMPPVPDRGECSLEDGALWSFVTAIPDEVMVLAPADCAAVRGRYRRSADLSLSNSPVWEYTAKQQLGSVSGTSSTPTRKFWLVMKGRLWCVVDPEIDVTKAILCAAPTPEPLSTPPLPTLVTEWLVPRQDPTADDTVVWCPASEMTVVAAIPLCTAPTRKDVGEGLDEDNRNTAERQGDVQGSLEGDTCKERTYLFMEDPDSSTGAAWFARFTLFVILASTVTLLVESLPKFHSEVRKGQGPWLGLEIGFVSYFTLELILRAWSTENCCEFLKAPLNIVDIVAVLPFYIDLVASIAGVSSANASAVRILRVVRVVRVFRLLKVVRYAEGIKLIAVVMGQSWDALLLVLFIVMICLMFASAFMFYLEGATISTFDEVNSNWNRTVVDALPPGHPRLDEYSPFQSIPHCFWWCIATFTLVGYGDEIPRSAVGKVIAGLSMVVGTFTLAIPASVFGSNFLAEYERHREDRNAKREGNEKRSHASVSYLLNSLLDVEERRPEWAEQGAARDLMGRLLWDDALSAKATRILNRAHGEDAGREEGASPRHHRSPGDSSGGNEPFGTSLEMQLLPMDQLRALFTQVGAEATRCEEKRKRGKYRSPSRAGAEPAHKCPTVNSIGLPADVPGVGGAPENIISGPRSTPQPRSRRGSTVSAPKRRARRGSVGRMESWRNPRAESGGRSLPEELSDDKAVGSIFT
eukprot:Hpha_TRINITY_DN29691_c0_g1::TRINITY_DN29691_c0_g1_i1::g.165133::m.165133/K04886/KCNB2; potassium voltage-gated channel Shab-related subfamily B member 2